MKQYFVTYRNPLRTWDTITITVKASSAQEAAENCATMPVSRHDLTRVAVEIVKIETL